MKTKVMLLCCFVLLTISCSQKKIALFNGQDLSGWVFVTDENTQEDASQTFTSSDGRFEMEFQPVMDRAACMDFKVIISDQHQVFGKMSGKAILDDGTVIEIKDVLCFAEKVHNKY